MDYFRLIELLEYDKISGRFYWKEKRGRGKSGGVAGHKGRGGYIKIGADGKYFRAHRLAWLYVYGYMPPEQIDHINGNPSDNRIKNLRLASHKQNQENQKLNRASKTGMRGVTLKNGRYVAIVIHNKKRHYFGTFDCPNAAEMAAEYGRNKLFTHNTNRCRQKEAA